MFRIAACLLAFACSPLMATVLTVGSATVSIDADDFITTSIGGTSQSGSILMERSEPAGDPCCPENDTAGVDFEIHNHAVSAALYAFSSYAPADPTPASTAYAEFFWSYSFHATARTFAGDAWAYFPSIICVEGADYGHCDTNFDIQTGLSPVMFGPDRRTDFTIYALVSAWSSGGAEFASSTANFYADPRDVQFFDLNMNPIQLTPEPSTGALSGLALLAVAWWRRRQK